MKKDLFLLSLVFISHILLAQSIVAPQTNYKPEWNGQTDSGGNSQGSSSYQATGIVKKPDTKSEPDVANDILDASNKINTGPILFFSDKSPDKVLKITERWPLVEIESKIYPSSYTAELCDYGIKREKNFYVVFSNCKDIFSEVSIREYVKEHGFRNIDINFNKMYLGSPNHDNPQILNRLSAQNLVYFDNLTTYIKLARVEKNIHASTVALFMSVVGLGEVAITISSSVILSRIVTFVVQGALAAGICYGADVLATPTHNLNRDYFEQAFKISRAVDYGGNISLEQTVQYLQYVFIHNNGAYQSCMMCHSRF